MTVIHKVLRGKSACVLLTTAWELDRGMYLGLSTSTLRQGLWTAHHLSRTGSIPTFVNNNNNNNTNYICPSHLGLISQMML